MSVVNAIPLIAAGDDGYSISRSLRFRSSASAYLSRTFGTPTNSLKYTVSLWLKRGTLSNIDTSFILSDSTTLPALYFSTANTLICGNGANSDQTIAVFRDPAAWYHIVWVYDSANATANLRQLIYINGVQQTLNQATIALNATSWNTSGVSYRIGAQPGASRYLDGYITEFNFIDGQALTPSSFGAFSPYNQWLPKKYSGTYGTNGFYLPFTNNASAATLGNDFSGNGNTWTTNNISVTAGSTYDSMTDVPTLTSATAANFAVLNPLNKATPVSITNGNLQMAATTAAWQGVWGSLGVSSEKWYFEATVTANNFAANGICIGIALATAPNNASPGAASNAWLYNNNNGAGAGRKLNGATVTNYGATYTLNDIIGVAVDLGAGTLEFYKNNTSQGVAFASGVSGTIFPYVSSYGTDAIALNCGQRPFTYTPPTGYLALNTFNL